ncbi:gamma-glutamylcyclotransferase [Methylocapsa sp. S129]|uniref:gamma-glutamylcyclotransferase n=1 Tax=Methylocapsa sp. S129 TaxID=1641869 RepID=UPI00131E069C|nr:gamma-glutamylcyclotransferase [Methylocapsa sp. S129]
MGEPGDLWVFGYGSLMWRPGFEYLERQVALVHGWRRSLCVYSHVYRGTPERPGLVLGLDRGGACHGVAFRVAASLREPTIEYLRERELVTAVYIERNILAHLADGTKTKAITYVADRNHPQYAGRLERELLLSLVMQGAGRSGPNADYVLNTEAHLRENGVRDPVLEWLAAQLRRA